MKLTFKKENLMNGINIVLKAVSSKTTMPILECILVDASTDQIKLTANDMELGIETKVEGNILVNDYIYFLCFSPTGCKICFYSCAFWYRI